MKNTKIYRVYKLTEKAISKGMDWPTAIVEMFDEDGNFLEELVEVLEVPANANIDEYIREYYPQYCDEDKYWVR